MAFWRPLGGAAALYAGQIHSVNIQCMAPERHQLTREKAGVGTPRDSEMIAASAISAIAPVRPQMPWEMGIAGMILSGQPIIPSMPALPVVALPFIGTLHEPPSNKTRTHEKSSWVPPLEMPERCFARAIHYKKRMRTIDQKEDDKRCRVLEQWKLIANEAGNRSRVGKFLSECRGDAAMELKVISDTVGSKATPTLEKRAGSILMFIRWMRVVAPGVGALPAEEKWVYKYICELRDFKAPATRASSLLEALNLANSLLEPETMETHASGRVKGAASDCLVKKRMTIQRPPLKVSLITGLEDLVVNGSVMEDRIFACFILFLTYARARYSDGMKVCNEPIVEGSSNQAYVETTAEGRSTKTGKKKRKLHRWFPMAGHAIGLTGLDWATSWLELREQQGLHAGSDRCLMPAPSGTGAFTLRPLEIDEANVWLKELAIALGEDPEISASLGTHSCKATCLSWAAKAGLSPSDRRILGGHAKSQDASMLEYSRDALADPLIRLGVVMDDISLGKFKPDAARSGYRPDAVTLRKRVVMREGSHRQEVAEENRGGLMESDPSEEEEGDSSPAPPSPCPSTTSEVPTEKGDRLPPPANYLDEIAKLGKDDYEPSEATDCEEVIKGLGISLSQDEESCSSDADDPLVLGPEGLDSIIPPDRIDSTMEALTKNTVFHDDQKPEWSETGMYEHQVFKTLHTGRIGDAFPIRRLQCYRKIDPYYVEITDWPSQTRPCCKSCFGPGKVWFL